MRLFFSDTNMSYRQISDLLTSYIGPAGPDTWQNGYDHVIGQPSWGKGGYIEVYVKDHPTLCFLVLKWNDHG